MNNDQRETLTEQELAELWLSLPGDKSSSQFAWAFARAIERAHGIGVMASDCTEPNRAACPRRCMDFCNKAEEVRERTAGVAPYVTTGWLIYTHQRIDPYYWHGPAFNGDEWDNRPIKRKVPVFAGTDGVEASAPDSRKIPASDTDPT